MLELSWEKIWSLGILGKYRVRAAEVWDLFATAGETEASTDKAVSRGPEAPRKPAADGGRRAEVETSCQRAPSLWASGCPEHFSAL